MEKAIKLAIEGGYDKPVFVNRLDFALIVVKATNARDRALQKTLEAVSNRFLELNNHGKKD